MIDPVSGSDDPDAAGRSIQEAKKIRIDLARLEKQAGAGNRNGADAEQVKFDAGPVRDLVEKYGSDLDKRQLALMMRDLDRAGGRGDSRTIRKIAEDVQSLRWRVLSTQDWYWKDALEWQKQPGRKFVRPEEARQWLEKATTALREGDSLSLQEAVRHLWQLRPKSDAKLDQERVMQAGLRRF